MWQSAPPSHCVFIVFQESWEFFRGLQGAGLLIHQEFVRVQVHREMHSATIRARYLLERKLHWRVTGIHFVVQSVEGRDV